MTLARAALLCCAALLLFACKQATTEPPAVSTAPEAQTLADTAFAAANAALALVYTNSDNTGTFSPASGLIASGTSTLSGSTYTFNETVTMTDYDPGETGIMATGDLVLKGSLIPGGTGTYSYTGDAFMSGAEANGYVVLDLSLKATATTLNFSGTVTVKGTEYTYSGTQ